MLNKHVIILEAAKCRPAKQGEADASHMKAYRMAAFLDTDMQAKTQKRKR
jgi:hypothetical protein